MSVMPKEEFSILDLQIICKAMDLLGDDVSDHVAALRGHLRLRLALAEKTEIHSGIEAIGQALAEGLDNG